MLHYRIFSGFGLILLFFLLFALDGYLEAWTGLSGLVLLAIAPLFFLISMSEFAAVLRAARGDANVPIMVLITLLIAILFYGGAQPVAVLSAMALAFGCTLMVHAREGRIDGALATAGGTMLGIVYIGMFACSFLLIRQEHSAWVVLGLLLIIKSGDIGAYFTGKAIGRHKLIPWISPGKTIEGLMGGVLFTIIAAVGLALLANANPDLTTIHKYNGIEIVPIQQQYSIPVAVLFGLAIAIAGLLGDLTMSLFKRDAQLKDSGQLLPGMGGILDVIDSPLLAAPIAYWLLKAVASPIQ